MKIYVRIVDCTLTDEVQNFNEEDMEFAAIASTNFAAPGSSRKLRVNMPAFIVSSVSRDQMYIPFDQIPDGMLPKKGRNPVKLFMRNRKEILSSFQMMMNHWPNCLTLVSSNKR